MDLEFTHKPTDIIKPATKYVVLRASSHALIKAWLAGKGDSLGKSHNTKQTQA
ncbi:MAG: hypothetical protein PVI92_12600 [Chromatiales bacterium]|jgi:hypothetical protein